MRLAALPVPNEAVFTGGSKGAKLALRRDSLAAAEPLATSIRSSARPSSRSRREPRSGFRGRCGGLGNDPSARQEEK